MTADLHCQTPFGAFDLRRYPARRDEPLQAWCAADLLLLEESYRLGVPREQLLAVNDEHGVLAVALQPRALWTDSALAALALARNLAANRREPVPVLWSTASPPAGIALVVLRVPKQLPYFEYQLALLARALAPGAVVLAAGMDKHLSPRVPDLLEQYIGPTERHRGQRKARLFSARRDAHSAPAAPAPARYHCAALAADLESLPNVFSQDRPDGGSELLLAQLDAIAPVTHLIDLACGNGILGLAALQRGLAQQVVFADESAMAVASAARNAAALLPGRAGACSFHHGDGLESYSGPPPDLILCNPPFHLNHAVDEYAGRRLLAQCARQLPAGGQLLLVANQHLAYLPSLRRQFGEVRQLGRDRRFVVWLAERA